MDLALGTQSSAFPLGAWNAVPPVAAGWERQGYRHGEPNFPGPPPLRGGWTQPAPRGSTGTPRSEECSCSTSIRCMAATRAIRAIALQKGSNCSMAWRTESLKRILAAHDCAVAARFYKADGIEEF